MPTITLQLPTMYGDHHVTAVRNLLLALHGVEDIYASSGFQVAQISFDERLVTADEIRAALDESGYLGELPVAVETGAINRQQAIVRHTASSAQTGVLAFHQAIPATGKPLWPCPGVGHAIHVEEEQSDGQER